jgi:hypothetical protein
VPAAGYTDRMVRHEAKARLDPQGRGGVAACCACPTGEGPVPVGAGAPGSRPQAAEADQGVRAGRHKPVRRRKPRSREQARGAQHEVKPAASTDLQPAGRAAHVTAKATSLKRDPKREGDCGGVWGAARVQGQVRNVRGPSARPGSGPASSYKPKAKSSRAQRESEAIVVLDAGETATKAVGHAAAAGKGPCGGHAEIAGKREVAGVTGPNDPVELESSDKVRPLRRQLWAAAKRAPGGRNFLAMCVHRWGLATSGRRGDRLPGAALLARVGRTMLRADGPLVSRVREVRMHGLNGGVGSVIDLRA